MTLDCEPFGFFQPRVITLQSYYLTSLVNLSFYGFSAILLVSIPLHFLLLPLVLCRRPFSGMIFLCRYGFLSEAYFLQAPVSLIGLYFFTYYFLFTYEVKRFTQFILVYWFPDRPTFNLFA